MSSPVPTVNDGHVAAYRENGYVVLRDWIEPEALDAVEAQFAALANMAEMHSIAFASELAFNRSTEARLHDSMRAHPCLTTLARTPSLLLAAAALTASPRLEIKACRFRMDQPHVTRELAVWHQDHAYVGGSIETVTAWAPLQDTDWVMGPLLVRPGSHRQGPLPHDDTVGKRKVPSMSFNEYWNPGGLQLLPCHRGDVVFFHSLLLHSGQVNLSDRVRFSVQLRYEPVTE